MIKRVECLCIEGAAHPDCCIYQPVGTPVTYPPRYNDDDTLPHMTAEQYGEVVRALEEQ